MTGDPIAGSTLWGARIHGTRPSPHATVGEDEDDATLMMMAVITYNIFI